MNSIDLYVNKNDLEINTRAVTNLFSCYKTIHFDCREQDRFMRENGKVKGKSGTYSETNSNDNLVINQRYCNRCTCILNDHLS